MFAGELSQKKIKKSQACFAFFLRFLQVLGAVVDGLPDGQNHAIVLVRKHTPNLHSSMDKWEGHPGLVYQRACSSLGLVNLGTCQSPHTGPHRGLVWFFSYENQR